MDGEELEARIVRVTRSLSDVALRASYLADLLRATPVAILARTLDRICARAEQAEEQAREVLLSLVDALGAPDAEATLVLLRRAAASESLLSLERLVRHLPPSGASAAPGAPDDPEEARIPDYVKGRTLTLGERKSLARRPDRTVIDKLLRDPHPDVIRRLLKNPRLTEDDVVRLASRRPGRPDVLGEIARTPSWAHRARVRLALMLNPDTPAELAAPIAGLLLRQELRLVVESTQVPPHIRALCMEHLDRRPPVEKDEGHDPIQ